MSELSQILDGAFDTDKEEGSPDFTPIPVGNYVVQITEAQVGDLKSGNGQSVRFTAEISGGEYDGRKVFDQIIISHTSADAMKFGRQKLKDVCTAVGFTGKLTDLTVLQYKPFNAYVKVEQDKDGEFPPKNRIGRVKPIAKPETSKGNGKPFNDSVPF